MTALSGKLEESQTVVAAKEKQISVLRAQDNSAMQKLKAEIAAKDKQFSDLTVQIASTAAEKDKVHPIPTA
jgi:glycine cleavage system regulatory protein